MAPVSSQSDSTSPSLPPPLSFSLTLLPFSMSLSLSSTICFAITTLPSSFSYPAFVMFYVSVPHTDPLFFFSTVSVSRSLSHTGLVWRQSWRPMRSGDRLWGHSRLRTSPTCRNSKVGKTVSKLCPNLPSTLSHCHCIPFPFPYLTTHRLSMSFISLVITGHHFWHVRLTWNVLNFSHSAGLWQ